MTINPFAGELADEHGRDLRQHAVDYRLARSARRPGRRTRANRFNMRFRPVRPEDSPLLADIFAGLSPASRLARFLIPKRALTTAELRYFTDVDHHNHEALIAVTRLRGEPVGVARFIRNSDDPTSADVAVEVVDEWQNRGVGSMLAVRLAARAQRENISQFTALMSAANPRSRQLLTRVGDVTRVARDGPTVSYTVVLPAPTPSARRTPHVGPRPVSRWPRRIAPLQR